MTNGSLDGAGESDYEGVTVWIGDAADGDVGLDDDRRGPKPAAVPFVGGRSSDASTNVPLRRCREAFGAKNPRCRPQNPRPSHHHSSMCARMLSEIPIPILRPLTPRLPLMHMH